MSRRSNSTNGLGCGWSRSHVANQLTAFPFVLEVRAAFLPERDELGVKRRFDGAAIEAPQRPGHRKSGVELLPAREARHHPLRFFLLRMFGQRRHLHEIDAGQNGCASRSARSAWSDELLHTRLIERASSNVSGVFQYTGWSRKPFRASGSDEGSNPCPSA
jgi:hypothetical protein